MKLKAVTFSLALAFLAASYAPLIHAQGMEITSAKVQLQLAPPNLEKAEELLMQALEKDPEEPRAHYLLGAISYYRGKYERVMEHWSHLKFDKKGEPEKLKNDEKRQYEQLRSDLYRNSFNKASGLFNDAKYEEAVTNFRVAAWANPDDPNAPLFLGYALLNTQQIDEAIPVLEEIVKADPKNVQAWDGLATAYVRKQDTANIIRSYTNFIELAEAPGINAFLLLRNAYFDTGDTAKVMATYEKAIVTHPGEMSLYRDLSSMYAERRQFDKAASLLEKALKSQGDDPELLLYLGTVYYNIGFDKEGAGMSADANAAFSKGVAPLEKHLAMEPNSIDGWDTLGKIYHGLATTSTDEAKIVEFSAKGDEYIARSKELIRTGEGK